MARRPRVFAAGVLYHVIARGNQRQKTFTSDSDYRAYIERLARYRKKYDYKLHAYCLMPNRRSKPMNTYIDTVPCANQLRFYAARRRLGSSRGARLSLSLNGFSNRFSVSCVGL